MLRVWARTVFARWGHSLLTVRARTVQWRWRGQLYSLRRWHVRQYVGVGILRQLRRRLLWLDDGFDDLYLFWRMPCRQVVPEWRVNTDGVCRWFLQSRRGEYLFAVPSRAVRQRVRNRNRVLQWPVRTRPVRVVWWLNNGQLHRQLLRGVLLPAGLHQWKDVCVSFGSVQ